MKYISSRSVRRLADLPNQHGYEFTGVTHAGSQIKCVVKKNDAGMHHVYNAETGEPCFLQLQGWRLEAI